MQFNLWNNKTNLVKCLYFSIHLYLSIDIEVGKHWVKCQLDSSIKGTYTIQVLGLTLRELVTTSSILGINHGGYVDMSFVIFFCLVTCKFCEILLFTCQFCEILMVRCEFCDVLLIMCKLGEILLFTCEFCELLLVRCVFWDI